MTKPKPCTHRRRTKVRHFAAIRTEASHGRPAYWGVVEVMGCVKCGEELGGRWAPGKIHKTERAALKAYGVPEEDLPPPANWKPKAAVSAAAGPVLWPFPESTRFHPDGTAKAAA